MKALFSPLMWLACITPLTEAVANTIRVYYIGNSVTDTVRYGALVDPALAAVIQQTVWRVVTAHPDSGVARKAEK